jgi:hypothetical protein
MKNAAEKSQRREILHVAAATKKKEALLPLGIIPCGSKK